MINEHDIISKLAAAINGPTKFLSDKELVELTGYKRGKDQVKWLEKRGYYVECNARGVPKITHNQVEEKRRIITASAQKTDIDSAVKTEPNVSGLQRKLKLIK